VKNTALLSTPSRVTVERGSGVEAGAGAWAEFWIYLFLKNAVLRLRLGLGLGAGADSWVGVSVSPNPYPNRNPKTAFFLFCTKKIDPYPAFYWDPSLQKHHFFDDPPLDHLRTRVLLMKLNRQPATKLSSLSRLAKQCFPFTGTFRFKDGQRSCHCDCGSLLFIVDSICRSNCIP